MSTQPQQPILEVDRLHHEYSAGRPAIDSVSFTIGSGELVSIVGPSGCGKTTLMKSIAGLMRFTSGTVRLRGQDVNDVPADLAMVFQDYGRSLFPWMTVEANVELPLRYLQVSKRERKDRTAHALAEVGLSRDSDKYPWQLSGGMQQRAAIARALAYRPRLLLMDEPFASVDAQTRSDLEDLVAAVHRKHGTTIMFVTHDIDEAIYLGDRVVVLTGAPSRTLKELPIDLPADRDQIETKATSEFIALRSEVALLIRQAVAESGHRRTPQS
ncbi:NitT/TauT family transport system ATP-binding protein [Sinosporangium album]|uniref:NitT/TauT family transport system ATP-binding protein n=1 Tax=Sinosporangium album TaxID=504805 RepID=A0A1G7ZV50_9ACTN|nr:ABC transporter ATP-binding protein [Sinosporangium album]SDH12609.1 NitT/TauT family transport system ATP-binding protein [Sinosporangium album]